MKRVKLEIFYSKTCPNCPAQKQLAEKLAEEEDDVKAKMTNVSRNQQRAQNHGVRAVPTTIISGPGVEEKMGLRGVTREEKLRQMVKVAKGELDPEEVKSDSIVTKIKDKLFGRGEGKTTQIET